MSKNTQGTKGLESLQVLVTPTPEPEVVAAIVNDLQSIPEYAVIEQVQELLQERAHLVAEEKRVLDEAGSLGVQLPDLTNRIAGLRGRLSQFKADAKNAVLNSDGIANIRASILGVKRLADHLETFTEKQLESSSNYTNMRDELHTLVARANTISGETARATARANELRQAHNALETEARELLLSINLA